MKLCIKDFQNYKVSFFKCVAGMRKLSSIVELPIAILKETLHHVYTDFLVKWTFFCCLRCFTTYSSTANEETLCNSSSTAVSRF